MKTFLTAFADKKFQNIFRNIFQKVQFLYQNKLKNIFNSVPHKKNIFKYFPKLYFFKQLERGEHLARRRLTWRGRCCWGRGAAVRWAWRRARRGRTAGCLAGPARRRTSDSRCGRPSAPGSRCYPGAAPERQRNILKDAEEPETWSSSWSWLILLNVQLFFTFLFWLLAHVCQLILILLCVYKL